MNNWNGGTRTSDKPEGDGSLEREQTANDQALRVAELCRLQQQSGGLFSIENPKSRFVWKFGPMLSLLQSGAFWVKFDQCEYELRPPHVSKNPKACDGDIRINKPTRLLTHAKALEGLSLSCTHNHNHFRCQGSVKVGNTRIRVSTAAGVYPPKLCARWASLLRAGAGR